MYHPYYRFTNNPVAPPPDVTGVTGGKGDNEKRVGRQTFKPTGLIDRPVVGRKGVQDRLDDSARIQAEVAEQVAREFGEETLRLRQEPTPVERMSLREIDAEIAALLRKKLRTEEEEIVLLLLIAATA